jgi:hypothetical protein
MNKLVQRSFINALGTVAYITLIAVVMSSLQKYAGDKPDGFFAPVLFLTLFVLSAAVTGSLVIGKPVLMFLGDQKTEAINLFFYTLGWLAAALVILLIVNLK